MLKELKYLFFIIIVFLIFLLTLKYYFSDINKKNSYRLTNQIDKKIINFSKKLKLLNNNTNNVIEYVENTADKNKKKYNFWKLITNNEK